jgi:pimeloyl-ACP methyl ester carboxylesterase
MRTTTCAVLAAAAAMVLRPGACFSTVGRVRSRPRALRAPRATELDEFQPMIFRRDDEDQKKALDRTGGRNLFFSPSSGNEQICYDAIYAPDPDAPNVVVLPYLYSPKNQGVNAMVESWCRREGYTYVCADYFGVSKSGGWAEDGTVSRWTKDTIALLESVVQGKTILVGAAVGAWVMLRVAMERPDLVAGLVGISCDADFTEELLWAQLSDEDKSAIMEKGAHDITWGENTYSITRNLIEDGRKNLVLQGDTLPIHCPVRLIHGTDDAEVPLSVSMRVMEQLESDDVDVVCIKGMGHFIDREKEFSVLRNVMAAVVNAADLFEVDLTSPGSG